MGGQSNVIDNSCRSAIIGGQNLTLSGYNDTVLIPNLQVNTSISTMSGGTMTPGITAVISASSTLHIVNGIIVDFS